MTTATAPGIDLSWTSFTDEEHGESCHYVSDPCSRQATHAGIFRLVAGNCEHFSPRILYCLIHRDLILRQAGEWHHHFCCHSCGPRTIVKLVRMVAL